MGVTVMLVRSIELDGVFTFGLFSVIIICKSYVKYEMINSFCKMEFGRIFFCRVL